MSIHLDPALWSTAVLALMSRVTLTNFRTPGGAHYGVPLAVNDADSVGDAYEAEIKKRAK